MRIVPVLSVEPVGEGLRYRLELPEAATPLQEELRHPVDAATLRTLQEIADDLLRSPESPRFPEEARARGGVLYRTLVPARLRAQLKAVDGPLLVSTSLYGLPWELLYDGEQFWGLRYALGKRLVMARPLPPPGRAARHARPRALVIGSDPRGDLPFVAHEVEAVCDALEAVAEVTCLAGRLATFDAVVAALHAGVAVVHYCGHVVAGADRTPALLLADGQTLAATAIEENVTGRPLVFLNGCASARGGDAHRTEAWEETFASVAYGFLFGGAAAVVGTLSDVGDRHAATLATEFYRRALAPAPVGEALRAARVRCADDPAIAGSPTWLSVVLYGNPAQVLLPGTAEPEPVPSTAPAERPRRRIAPRAAFVVVLLALVAGMLRFRQPAPPGPLVVGVMAVSSRGAVPSWMREMTRDGLNTILSRFDGLRVYSRQKIDFVREKRQLSEIEAAEALGMRKMISASVASDGALVTLSVDVVDIPTGLLQASDEVQGPEDKFMELQAEFALRTLRVLGIEPTPEQAQGILASRRPETLNAYRMLTDTLGDPVGGGTKSAPALPPPHGTSWLEWRAQAWAQGVDPDEAAIRSLVAAYGAALQAKSVDQLGALQVEMGAPQRASLQRYFDNARDLRVRISNVDVAVEGSDALATFTREDTFTDGGSGRPMRLEIRISGVLVKDNGQWRIRGLRDPS